MKGPTRPRPPRETTCPKCKHTSGNDWTQCKGSCPMPGSPHYTVGAPPPLPAVAPKPMGPAELREGMLRKGISGRELARQCARNERTVRSWLSGRERMGVEVSAVVRGILA